MTWFKLGSEMTGTRPRPDQPVMLSDKRVIPPHPHKKRIAGTLHLPLSH
jgi:hypothetical protein